MTIIGRGAEAILTREGKKVIKDRISKSYRLPILDEQLRKKRTKSEAKILEKLSGNVNVPKLLKQDKFNIEIEFIDGDKLSDTLNGYPEKKQEDVMKLLAKQVSAMHDLGIIHGDLTTSNVILVNEKEVSDQKPHQITTKANRQVSSYKNKVQSKPSDSEALYLIDFGLSFHSLRMEDKAVDLHLIKQALEAKHFMHWEKLFKSFLSGYKPKDGKKVLEQLKKVEARGRYKH